jgi:predicted RNase H-like HicB family nuclease
MKYAVVIEQGPTSFGATVPDLPGCFAVAKTRGEVERLIQEAIVEHVALLRKRGQPVPSPSSKTIEVDV